MKQIPGYENRYSVTVNGRVWSHISNKWLSKMTNNQGRDMFWLINSDHKGKWFLSYRLVALTYIPNPNNYPQVHHKVESNPQNNHYSNLWWGTQKQNFDDMMVKKRNANGTSILTSKDVLEIRAIKKPTGLSNRQFYMMLDNQYGVGQTAIWAVVNRRSWKFH